MFKINFQIRADSDFYQRLKFKPSKSSYTVLDGKFGIANISFFCVAVRSHFSRFVDKLSSVNLLKPPAFQSDPVNMGNTDVRDISVNYFQLKGFN